MLLAAGEEKRLKNVPEHLFLARASLKRNCLNCWRCVRSYLTREKRNTQFPTPLAILSHRKGGEKTKKQDFEGSELLCVIP